MKYRSHIILLLLFILGLTACNDNQANLNDWPQYKKDNYRSGASDVNLDLNSLDLAWSYTANQEPVPAWYGPAMEDAYARSGPLPSMRDYDLAYYPIVVGDNLYYGSSADDAVHCIDANTGIEKWTFTTGGPIRVAPTYYKGKLYFGSDDGYAYCVNAFSAKLEWKFSPSPKDEPLVLNNSRLISYWPIRTGLLVEDDKAYFGASLLPWNKSYFCAVDVDNGRADGPDCYVREVVDMSLEGSMASTGKLLIQPQGRISPAFINKKDGSKKGRLPGTGGCFVLVTPDKHVVHPQGSRNASIREFVNNDQPNYMSFKGGKEMVIKGDTSFILSDHSVSAYHRKSKKILWLRRNYEAHRIIKSGDNLFVGTVDTVYALNTKNGLPIWSGKVKGVVHALATANNALYVSTGEGEISCFKAGGKKNALLSLNSGKPAIIEEQLKVKTSQDILDPNVNITFGPCIEAVSHDSIQLSFETDNISAFELIWSGKGQDTLKYNLDNSLKYKISLPVRKGFTYNYQIISEDGDVGNYEYDNFLNFDRKALSFEGLKSATKDLKTKLKTIDVNQSGLALVIGEETNDLSLQLAKLLKFDIIALNDNEDDVEDKRELLQAKAVYGRKVNVQFVQNLNELPITSELANLVWVNSSDDISTDELIRLIAPRGIAVLNHVSSDWSENSNLIWQVDIQNLDDNSVILKKHTFEREGDWTHEYAHADNSAYGGESLWGSTRSEDFNVQWMGRPGPRFQTDRSGRKPSPLAVGGKMFIQGNQRIAAVDVYNGSILWSKQFPGFRRMNTHRDCSNWVADSTHIYMAITDKLVKVNQTNGHVETIIPVGDKNKDWGYISLTDNKILGSLVPNMASYTDFHGGGGDGWYDAQTGSNTQKVVSYNLFAKDISGENLLWNYKPKGYIINSTITIYENVIYFVETSKVKLTKEGRGGDNIFDNTWLVSIDIDSGKQNWKRKFKTWPGIAMFSMAAGNGKLVIVSSHNKKYMIYSFDSNNGDLVWEKEQIWFHGDHGAHLSRPAIAGNRLVVKPVHYNLETGEAQNYNVPKSGHGCASYALTEQAIFYRGGSVTQFNFDTREFSRWERLRPDCWISTIPAQGMILSPEAGGGCSCGNWLETSMVLAPKSRAPITIKTYGDKKPDYKEETWGEYTQRYQPNEFVDSLQVEAILKPGLIGTMRYTIDGSEPTKTSSLYSGIITIDESTTLKVAVFIEKDGRIRKFVRNRSFVKLRPVPTIERQRSITKGCLQVKFHRATETGKVYYSIDGSEPTSDSNEGSDGVMISDKTLVKARTIWIEKGKEYSSEVVSKKIEIPVFQEAVSAEVKPGIHYEYYEGEWTKLPDFKSIKAIREGVMPIMNVDLRTKDKHYGFRFKGYLNIPVDGIYTFYTACDDGSYVFLHNEEFIDDGGSHGPKEKKKDIALKAGLHPISIIYYQVSGGQAFSENIEGPNMPKQAIPANLLFHN